MSRPQRMCLGCGTRRAKVELVRLVAENGRLVVDELQRRPGRGGYLCPSGACLERFMRLKEDRLRRVFRSAQRLCPEGLRERFAEPVREGKE